MTLAQYKTNNTQLRPNSWDRNWSVKRGGVFQELAKKEWEAKWEIRTNNLNLFIGRNQSDLRRFELKSCKILKVEQT